MSTSNTWFYETDGQRNGPVSLQVIRSLSRQGVIAGNTLVSDDSDKWVRFSELASQLNPAAVVQPPAVPAASAPTGTPVNGSVPMFASNAASGTSVSVTGSVAVQAGSSDVTGFGDAITVCLNKYATFSGRAGRPEFWYFQLFSLIVNLLLITVFMAILPMPFFVVIGQLALIIPLLSVSVRRLHDTDKSGWWLLMYLVPFIGPIVMIVFFIQRGTQDPNRFG